MSDAVVSAINGQIALRLPRRALRMLVYLLVATIAVLTVSLMSGSYPLSPVQVWDTLFTTAPSDIASTVVWEFRFPRVLVAFFVGAFLALSGATLQYVTRNPLADPSLVGVSQGAALAVVSVTILSPETDVFLRPLVAFAGSLAVAALILLASSSQRAASTLRFILMGIGVAALISALTSALLTYGDINRAMTALGWLAGSVHTVGWNEVCWLAVTRSLRASCLVCRCAPLVGNSFWRRCCHGSRCPDPLGTLGFDRAFRRFSCDSCCCGRAFGFCRLGCTTPCPTLGPLRRWLASMPHSTHGCIAGGVGRPCRPRNIRTTANTSRSCHRNDRCAGFHRPNLTKPITNAFVITTGQGPLQCANRPSHQKENT